MLNEEINDQLGIGQDEVDVYDYEVVKRGKDKEQKSKCLLGVYSLVLVYNRKLLYDFFMYLVFDYVFFICNMQLIKRCVLGL